MKLINFTDFQDYLTFSAGLGEYLYSTLESTSLEIFETLVALFLWDEDGHHISGDQEKERERGLRLKTSPQISGVDLLP